MISEDGVDRSVDCHGGSDFSSAYVLGYEEGALTIDVVDARARRLVWQASAQAPIDEQLSQAQRFTRLQEAIREMLRQFPPGSGNLISTTSIPFRRRRPD